MPLDAILVLGILVLGLVLLARLWPHQTVVVEVARPPAGFS